jgi:hypothetical protein
MLWSEGSCEDGRPCSRSIGTDPGLRPRKAMALPIEDYALIGDCKTAASAAVIDFMPPGDGADLVRIVIGRSGRMVFRTELVVRFNYGATVPWVDRVGGGAIAAIAGQESLLLRTPVALYGEDLKTVGEFAVEAGQSIPFVLSYELSSRPPPPALDAFEALERTEAFWRNWSDRCPEVA